MKFDRVEKVSLGLAIAACLTGSVAAATTLSESPESKINQPSITTEQGVFISKSYHEDGDYTSMVIETSDGTTIEVSDYVAPLQDSCELFYDEDGNIIGVRAFHKVSETTSK